tara:strand:+ start:145 stop:498 length:354 start_codon:yes stop_codon:yes gene_type:complete
MNKLMRLIRSWTRLEKLENGKWVYRAIRLSKERKPMFYLANKKIICFSYILMLCEVTFLPMCFIVGFFVRSETYTRTIFFNFEEIILPIIFFIYFFIRFVYLDKYASNKLHQLKNKL